MNERPSWRRGWIDLVFDAVEETTDLVERTHDAPVEGWLQRLAPIEPARSAAHYGSEHGEPWVERLRHIACLGSPHLGAPLEKAVNLLGGILRKIDAAGAHVPAELLDARSADIKDLRYGYMLAEIYG
jgi:hypothetical protein